jgi:hypothetical protein
MAGMDQALQIQGEIMANFSKGMLVIKESLGDDKKLKEEFIKEIKKVFEFLNSEESLNTKSKIDVPSFFLLSADITSDASVFINFAMKQIRDLVIDRLNSPTRNTPDCRFLIYRLLMIYYTAFNDAYIEHRRHITTLRDSMFIGFMNTNSSGVDAYTSFLDGPFFEELKRRQAEMKNTETKKTSWQDNAVKTSSAS